MVSEENFAKYAQEYDVMCDYNPHYQDLLQRVGEDIELLKGMEVLKESSVVCDLGSGTGNFVISALKPKFPLGTIYSIDNNSEFLKKQSEKLKTLNPEKDIKIVNADATHELPFERESLDLVLMIHSLNFLGDKRKDCLRNVNGYLREGGILITADINKPIDVDFWLNEVLIPEARRRGGEEEVQSFLKRTKFAYELNKAICQKQKKGDIWTPNLEQFCKTLEGSSFKILLGTERLYCKTDNYAIARKFS